MVKKLFDRLLGSKTKYLVILSAVLLVLAFPKKDIWPLAWVALIPFFFALDDRSYGKSFWIGYTLGFLFFAGTIYWFIYVSCLGALLLILYFACYFGIFGIFYKKFSQRNIIYKIFLIPGIWVVLEFIRAHLFTGFGWVSIGHSQYKNLLFIQISDITGVYGVSFIVVMFNVLLKEALQKFIFSSKENDKKSLVIPVFIVACVMIFYAGYGAYHLSNKSENDKQFRVAVIQGNVPQEVKWMKSARNYIFEKYKILTKKAALEKPDLIVWPETSLPGYIWETPEFFEELRGFVSELEIPLLVGLETYEEDDYYNSAFMLDGKGDILKKHNKIHLVPFGEYLPLREKLPFLSDIVPIGDFTPGNKYTLFPVTTDEKESDANNYFSVLICFEDTVSALWRKFSSEGSNMFINITNDAWFQDTKAPFLHMSAALFHAIENRRSIVRAANTGLSCFIDPYGHITRYAKDEHNKKTYVEGYAIENVALNDQKTFYTKYGDVFAYLCFGSILLLIVKRE